MFEASVPVSTFRNVIDSVGVLVDECRMRIEADGLVIRAADPAVVAMVDVSLQAEAFETYEADGRTLGINLARLSEVLSVAEADDVLHLELNEDRRTLQAEIGSLSYTLGLIDPETIREEPDIPDLDAPAEIVLGADHLDRGITAADMVADQLRLRLDDTAETFFIEAEGDTDDVQIEIPDEQLTSLSPGTADSLFSLDYLKEMNRAIPNEADVRIDLGEEFLLSLQYTFDNADPKVAYRLAPRIQST